MNRHAKRSCYELPSPKALKSDACDIVTVSEPPPRQSNAATVRINKSGIGSETSRGLHMVRSLFIAVLCAMAGGCNSDYERAASSDDGACRSYGAEPGTQTYYQCRMEKDQQRQANIAALSQMILSRPQPQPYVPQPYVMQPVRRSPTNCNSILVGATVSTSCY